MGRLKQLETVRLYKRAERLRPFHVEIMEAFPRAQQSRAQGTLVQALCSERTFLNRQKHIYQISWSCFFAAVLPSSKLCKGPEPDLIYYDKELHVFLPGLGARNFGIFDFGNLCPEILELFNLGLLSSWYLENIGVLSPKFLEFRNFGMINSQTN